MATDDRERIPWASIQPLSTDALAGNGAFAALDALRLEWERYLGQLTEAERTKIRQRSLRRLAIETGIIERLYDIEWGLTLTLIAEGFSRDAIERSGGAVDDRTRAALEAQRDSLQMVLDFVGAGRDLSASFIKELHAAMTRAQLTYTATDALGRIVEAPLEHGQWKTQPNHVELPDGRMLEYAPPEHVASEIDRLIEFHRQNERNGIHPLVSAAWLHHRFVQIHPFADGNGRVARALVLLVLQKHHYAPLVVDRHHRDSYLTALNVANNGDINPLVKLFLKLESAALAGELESPEEEEAKGLSHEVAHTLAAQLRAARKRQESKIQSALRTRSVNVAARVRRWFEQKELELSATFRAQELEDARVSHDFQMGEAATRAYWFRHQIITAARRSGHYAEFGAGSGWCGLRVSVGGVLLRYVAALHGAGRASGVLAVVTFGEIETLDGDGNVQNSADRQPIETSADAFRVVYTESTDDIEQRSSELTDLLDEGLSVALVHLFRVAR